MQNFLYRFNSVSPKSHWRLIRSPPFVSGTEAIVSVRCFPVVWDFGFRLMRRAAREPSVGDPTVTVFVKFSFRFMFLFLFFPMLALRVWNPRPLRFLGLENHRREPRSIARLLREEGGIGLQKRVSLRFRIWSIGDLSGAVVSLGMLFHHCSVWSLRYGWGSMGQMIHIDFFFFV